MYHEALGLNDSTYVVCDPVTIPYSKLLDESADLCKEIEEGFGFAGLGLIVVSDVPDFVTLREKLLPLGSKFARLPDSIKAKMEHPQSHYSFGWSHGKESLRKGVPDTHKGSFYNNPQYDIPTTNEELIKRYPEVCLPNIWPQDELPELETAFKNCGKKMVELGFLLIKHCDKYVEKKLGHDRYESGKLHRLISESRTCKARLLHYFPIISNENRSRDSWCGWHNDHDILTGLCPAMYHVAGKEEEIQCPDPEAGLYIRTRLNKTVKVRMPKHSIGFQIGESSQVLTGGLLRATPHAVQACKYPDSVTTERNTFAVFMQPNVNEPLVIPKGIKPEEVSVGQFRQGQDFGQFSAATIQHYYS